MAIVPRQERRREGAAAVLRGVSFKEYLRLIRHSDNRFLRMAYLDGTLEIVSPIYYAHEGPSRRLSLIVMFVARALGIRFTGAGALTFHRGGEGPLAGVGKEADQSFYLGSVDRFPVHREVDLDAGDPPPDLWVEVDDRVSSKGRLPVYARLGVPEVWQYRVDRKEIRFLRLVDSQYEPIERSLALPILTPGRVAEALAAGEGRAESDFLDWLLAWIPDLIARAAADDARPE